MKRYLWAATAMTVALFVQGCENPAKNSEYEQRPPQTGTANGTLGADPNAGTGTADGTGATGTGTAGASTGAAGSRGAGTGRTGAGNTGASGTGTSGTGQTPPRR